LLLALILWVAILDMVPEMAVLRIRCRRSKRTCEGDR